MFARRVTMHLKPNMVADFTRKFEDDVIPLLRKQNGFQDEFTFTTKDGREAFGISLWDRRESAEAYEKANYPQVTKMLEKVVDGTPRVDFFEVANSTCHKILAPTTK